MLFSYRLLGLEHLLGTAVLAGMTLFLSIRFPEPGANFHFRLTLALLAFSALSTIPFFLDAAPGRLALLPLGVFLAATLAFLSFAGKVITERIRAPRRRQRP